MILLENQKVTRGPYKHTVVLGPAVKPVFWLKFMFIVLCSGFLALVLQHCWMNLYGRKGLTAKVVYQRSRSRPSGGEHHKLSATIQEPTCIFKTPPCD